MNNVELQLRFLEGKPISLKPGLQIHKVSFSDVNEIGYLRYNGVINLLCLPQEKIIPYVTDPDTDVFTYIIASAFQSRNSKADIEEEDLLDDLLIVLQFIFNDTVSLDDQGFFKVGESGALHRGNFEEFQSIIKKRNCLESIDEDIGNPENAMAKRLLERRKIAREKLAKAKKQNSEDESEGLDITDLISIFAESEHVFLEDVFRYDIYQFNNQFNRMKIFKDYDVNVQALLAGAKSEDIKMQHWMSKIKAE